MKLNIRATVLIVMGLLLTASQAANQTRGVGVQIKGEDGKFINLYDKSYALVIGVSDYTAGWPRLPGVRRDIEAVSRALEAQGFQVTKVENPDSAHLDSAFREFIDAHGQQRDNRLLFYFAGHGHTLRQEYGEDMGYVVPTDAPNPARDRAGFRSKAMSMEQVELYAKRVQSKHALFVFDSCFSGSFFARSQGVPESIGYKTSRPVRQFITSGSAEELVPDQSVFRSQFVEALGGEADANKDGYVTGTELGMFLQDKVVNYTRSAQHPQYGKIRNPNLDKGDFVFETAAVAGNGAAKAGERPVDQLAVELAYWDAIKNSSDPGEYESYLRQFPNGRFSDLARRRSQPKNSAAVTPPRPTTGAAATEPSPNSSLEQVRALINVGYDTSISTMTLKVTSLGGCYIEYSEFFDDGPVWRKLKVPLNRVTEVSVARLENGSHPYFLEIKTAGERIEQTEGSQTSFVSWTSMCFNDARTAEKVRLGIIELANSCK
jgi:hypothetical protein